MDCTDFLESYSDYFDRKLDEGTLANYRQHLERCSSCARYDRILQKGLRLVRELPVPDPTPDFRQRLQHKLYHIHDDLPGEERRLTGVTGVAAAIIAGLLVASTLSVVRHDGGQVELPPVVIESPTQPATATASSARTSGARLSSTSSRVPGVFTGAPTGPNLLVVPDIGNEPWLVTPASSQVRLFRTPLTQMRGRPVGPSVSVSSE